VSAARILVIDDSVMDVRLLRLALDLEGEKYELETLTDGEAALQFIRDSRLGLREPEPCVIILDLHLPRHHGLTVLKAIKESPALAHINVVVLTGLANWREQDEIRKLGGVFLEKPTKLADFEDLGREIFAICREGVLVAH
jgi:CheY-like chemotaxis protein